MKSKSRHLSGIRTFQIFTNTTKKAIIFTLLLNLEAVHCGIDLGRKNIFLRAKLQFILSRLSKLSSICILTGLFIEILSLKISYQSTMQSNWLILDGRSMSETSNFIFIQQQKKYFLRNFGLCFTLNRNGKRI